jgi:fructose-bisphosphate aldolase class II
MQKVCEERMKQFGQAGQAAKVPVVSLDDMTKAYLAGKYGESAKPDERSAEFKAKK